MSNHSRHPRGVGGHEAVHRWRRRPARVPTLSAVFAALACAGCSGAQTPLVEPVGCTVGELPEAVSEEQPAAQPVESKPKPAEQPSIVSSLPYPWCTVPDSQGDALYFSTNSFALEPPSQEILNHLADCLTRGSLHGRRVVVVGYADPRGSKAYNRELALTRAQMTRRYLLRLGVDPSQVKLASRGSRLAEGIGPESWFYDRRVEVHLAPEHKSANP